MAFSWKKPTFDSEKEEFERVADEAGIPLEELRAAFQQAPLENLTDKDWSRLENTDSWETTSLEAGRELAQKYGRDIDRIAQGGALPAPIVLELDGKLTLVAGNTRLMVARALKDSPKVVWVKPNKIHEKRARSTYGSADPQIRTGSSGGTTGVGPHRGTPGYPVPPEMIPTEPQDPDAHDAFDPAHQDEGTEFDIKMSAADEPLGEGGSALDGDPVPRENVEPTIKAFVQKALKNVPHKSAKPIGSTGKKSQSGDLDLGLDTKLSLDQVAAALKELGLTVKVNKGLGEVSVLFPQVSPDGKGTGKKAQVDLMVGPEEWTQFQYYGPGESSKYSGVHVRGIVNAIVSVIAGHSVSPARGFFSKDDPEKKYVQDPKHAVALISKKSKEPWSVADLKQPFEKIWQKVQRSFGPDELAKIKEYYLGFMKSTKREVPSELQEADEHKSIPKGIEHLEDLKPEDFVRFLAKYKDLPIKGGLEVSEKVDGSARITFGLENGKLWVASKNSPKHFSSSEWSNKPMFAALRAGHEALERKAPQLTKAWPKGVQFFVAEVLYTKIPNSIEYGPNVIMIHGITAVDGKPVSEEESRKLATQLTKSVGGKLGDWLFEYKRVIKPEDVMVDVKEHYDSIQEIYKELKKLEPDKLKASGKPAYKAALEKFKAVQLALKKKLVGQLHKQRSAYGPEGGDVEGLVFRDLDSGQLVKLVDKEYFTKLNNFMWQYRKLLDTGVKVGEKWELGLMQKLRNALADDVLGHSAAKLQNFVPQLKKFGMGLEYPRQADTPEKRADFLLAQYVKHHKLMEGDPLPKFKKALADAQKGFVALKRDWDSKKGDLTLTVKEPAKKIKMDPLVQKRTDQAFDDMAEFLRGFASSLEVVGGMKGDLTKRTALMKLVVGQHRLKKLETTAAEDDAVGETIEAIVSEEIASLMELPATTASVKPRTPFTTGTSTKASKDKGLKAPEEPKKVSGATGDDELDFSHSGIDETLSRWIITNFKDLMAKKRHLTIPPNPRALGTGTRGTAFDIGGNKVLKITSDKTEAEAAEKMKGANMKHVVRIFDVFQFKRTGAFGIVQERLEKIPGTPKDTKGEPSGDAAELNDALLGLKVQQLLQATGYNWDQTKLLIARYVKTLLDKIKDPEEKAEFRAECVGYYNVLTKKYGIQDMVKELKANGVNFHDYHAGNIMVRPNGGYVVNDLGYSAVHGGKQPDVLEQIIREQMDQLFESPLAAGLLLALGLSQSQPKDIDKYIKDAAAKWNVPVEVVKAVADVESAGHPDAVSGKGAQGTMQLMPATAKSLGVTDPEDPQQNIDAGVHYLHKLSNQFGGNLEHTLAAYNAGPTKAKKALDAGLPLPKETQDYIKKIVDKLGGKEPELPHRTKHEDVVYEEIVRLFEKQASSVGVTLGRFQPFHKGHAEIIRKLAGQFGKVIVLVAGNKRDQRNPFSFELREELMKASLPDVMSKVEIHKAEFGGKASGYIPGVLNAIIQDGKSTLKSDTAVNILVGPDRYEDIKSQLARAQEYKATGAESAFDPDMAIVKRLPGVKNDDDTDRISGTRVRAAISQKNEKEVKAMMDPHLTSNPAVFHDLFERMVKELKDSGIKELREATNMVGGEGAIDKVLEINADKLRKAGVEVKQLKRLGAGMDGVAYEMHDGRVLKVTTDPKEATTDFSLVGKKLQHVVHIERVFRFENIGDTHEPGKPPTGVATKDYPKTGAKGAPPATIPKNAMFFGIIEEKLTPLTEMEAREFDGVMQEIFDDSKLYQFLYRNDWEEFKKALLEHLEEDIRRELEYPYTQTNPAKEEKLKKVLERKNAAKLHELGIYNIPSIMKELKANNVEFGDYHSGNLMKRGSIFVINDLGRSKSQGQTNRIPVIEQIVEEILRQLAEDGLGAMSGGPGTSAGIVGMKAGSSPWSLGTTMVDDDEEDGEGLWRKNRGRNFDMKKPTHGHPDLVSGKVSEIVESLIDEAPKMKPEQFEELVAKKLRDAGFDAHRIGGTNTMPDVGFVDFKIAGKKHYVEVKMKGAQLGSPRSEYVGGQWRVAGPDKDSEFAKMWAKKMNESPQAQEFIKSLTAFIQKKRPGVKTIQVFDHPSEPKTKAAKEQIAAAGQELVTLQDMMEFLETRKTQYVFRETGQKLDDLVSSHYLTGKDVPAEFMQYGDDFYRLRENDSLGLKDVPVFKGVVGDIGLRISPRGQKSGKRPRYEINPEFKARRVPGSPFSIVNEKGSKQFPFKREKK